MNQNLSADQFKKVEGGYLDPSGDYYLSRMARMNRGGTNGWGIHRRLNEDEVETDNAGPFHKSTGDPVVEVNGNLYHHEGDEGSLADAKIVVRSKK